jgi:TP53 regulating kinase-like protein
VTEIPVVLVQGAEAVIESVDWFGRSVLCKRRIPKPYRHPVLDARLRDERTRDEAQLLFAARRGGVPVPVVYSVDRAGGAITMERVPGPLLRDVLPDDSQNAAIDRLRQLGSLVGRLHNAGLTHGDLTTSNILIPSPDDYDSMVLIDFGLGQISVDGEDRAVDLHLVEEALEATDSRASELTASFLAGYETVAEQASDALRRLEGVRERGRYRGAS